jgi:hypothetical protein
MSKTQKYIISIALAGYSLLIGAGAIFGNKTLKGLEKARQEFHQNRNQPVRVQQMQENRYQIVDTRHPFYKDTVKFTRAQTAEDSLHALQRGERIANFNGSSLLISRGCTATTLRKLQYDTVAYYPNYTLDQ